MILGEQGLHQIWASVDFFEYKLYYSKPITSHKINYTNDNPNFESDIIHLIQKNENFHSSFHTHNK